jgi:multidrug resistance efflux pump
MLAKRWGCVRVAIGLTENESIALNTLSDRVAFDEKSHGAAHLAVAMNEACDQSACIVFPELDSQQGGPTVNAAHRQLAAAHRASIASVPLRTPAAIVGVVTLIRNESVPFTNDDLRHLEQRAALLGRVIATRRQAEQSTASRIRCAVQRWRDDWLLAKDWRRRSAVAATAAAAAFAAFGSVSHQVSAPALLAGVSERTLASPVDGYLSEVHVRPGARVTSGDVLAVLDPSPLQRQRQQLLGQRNQLNGEYNVALSNLDGASARILQAQLAQTNVQLAHLDEQIERLAITAPFDGLVLEGDLMHATGSPVALGDALFRVTPDEGYLVRLMVDESDVSALSIGAGGRLKLAALPDAELAIEVVRINGVAQTRDGRSVIEIEAAVKGDQRYLRPGMKGVARLDAGRAGLLWIWTHSIVQRLQLWLWQFSPVA